MGINWVNMAQLSKKVTGLSWSRFTQAHVPGALLAALVGVTAEIAAEGARAAHLGNIPVVLAGGLVAGVATYAAYRLWPAVVLRASRNLGARPRRGVAPPRFAPGLPGIGWESRLRVTAAGGRIMLERMKAPLRRLRADLHQLTGPLRGLPSALIIGAQKSGTTSLFNYLVRHPDVLAPFAKEIHYFDLHYDRGLRWYRGHFPYSRRLRDGTLTLDASPYYLVHPQVPQRAFGSFRRSSWSRCSATRWTARFRTTSTRFAGAGNRSRSPRRSIARPSDWRVRRSVCARDPDYYSYNHHRYSYTLRGRYLDQLQRWTEHFPAVAAARASRASASSATPPG